MKPITKNQLSELWMAEFVVKLHCGLCGNTGKINTIGRAVTPGGVECGGVFWCICPNGRSLKRAVKSPPHLSEEMRP